ncbi:MAG: ExbD/TolR family protein [Spirochaetaceae bacterium]
MKFKRRLKPTATVELVPMIDVVFQLVVFFMVSSTFILTPGISLTLPESSTAEPVVMGKLVVTIVSEEEIFLNKEEYTLDGIEEALDEIRESGDIDSIRTVVVEGDRGVSYSLMVKVLDTLRRGGFEGVNLRMREE